MNFVDLFLIIVVIFSIYNGWLKGFIIGMIELLTFTGGVLFAFFTYSYVVDIFGKYFPQAGALTVPLSFIITLLFIRIFLSFLANKLVQLIPPSILTNHINYAFGIIPGAINGFIWATIISAILLLFPFSDGLINKSHNSFLAEKLADKIGWLSEKFSPVFDNAVGKTMHRITAEPEAENNIKLPFTVKQPKVREDLEAEMLDLVNEERKKAGIKALKFDKEMLPVARAHSADMFEKGYFSHITPAGLTPFDRMKNAKVHFLVAGENLAYGQTLLICHKGLMNSPGHRANILNPAFGRVGIAILSGGFYGLMITQNFRN